ncbi:UbiA family prenyltransferase [candidate division WOR-3 bacterium]|nr:UbiA family prenyltransferase [candidate division WOR-3 bacterium]
MKKILAFISLLRPLNGIIGASSVFIGAWLTHKKIIPIDLALACIACFLIIGAGNAINDYVDAEIDMINKPKRPIPSGKVTKRQALIISTILFILALEISLKISINVFIIALVSSLLLLVYNFNLKRKGISGNILVTCLGGMPFVYGGVVVKSWLPTLIPFSFAFLLHLSREILKDIIDIKGDKVIKSISFPIKHGIKKSINLTILVLSVLILLTPMPFIFHLYGMPYLIAVLICIDLTLGLIIYKLLRPVALRQLTEWTGEDKSFIPKACNLLKFNMVIGLGVLALGYY